MIADQTRSTELAMRRAQVYGFLSGAFLYPGENWTEDRAYVADALEQLGYSSVEPFRDAMHLDDLQSEYLRTIGVSGPLTYETEYGLESSYRQSQELADIAGFYGAFGFTTGGAVRERPDHIAAELEFMHVLTLKEWRAASSGEGESLEICVDAERKFLGDHLGRWIGAFAIRARFEAKDSLYADLARFAAAFVHADLETLGVELEPLVPEMLKPTPFDVGSGCGDCPVPEGIKPS